MKVEDLKDDEGGKHRKGDLRRWREGSDHEADCWHVRNPLRLHEDSEVRVKLGVEGWGFGIEGCGLRAGFRCWRLLVGRGVSGGESRMEMEGEGDM